MKLTRVGPGAIFYRYHTPMWAHLPKSGAGAAMNGGRFNRPGAEALYLSQDTETALAEYAQGSSIVSPGTLVAYELEISDVWDFSAGYENTWHPMWQDWSCDWKHIARILGTTPPTWKMGDQIISNGGRGLLFPSVRRKGGVNIVLFHANLSATDRFEPYDPGSSLPKNRSSWEP